MQYSSSTNKVVTASRAAVADLGISYGIIWAIAFAKICLALFIIFEIIVFGVCLVGGKWVKNYCSIFRFYLTNIIQP
jgi:uncharacterized membrane protein